MNATRTGSQKRSIRTVYNEIEFRSKLEADWARAFDAIGVEWEYEGRGHYFGDVFYLPDFWLPKSRQFVEVKGVFEPQDCRKIQALVRHAKARPFTGEWCPDISIVACMPDGVFFGWERTATPRDDWWQFLTKAAKSVELFGCTRCNGWWFCDANESFQCQCCGEQYGDHYVLDTFASPLRVFGDHVGGLSHVIEG